jgi:hypothetical protein
MSNTKDLTRREFVAGTGRATLGAMVAASAPLIVLKPTTLALSAMSTSPIANVAWRKN